jgi:hypothetical protein
VYRKLLPAYFSTNQEEILFYALHTKEYISEAIIKELEEELYRIAKLNDRATEVPALFNLSEM